MIDNNDIMEFHKSSIARQKELALAESAKKEQLKQKDRSFYSRYYDSLNQRAIKENEAMELMSNSRNTALSTCIKAIYITALEANTLTDESRILAERLVDNYISEKGGAEKIFNETADRSYLLSRLSQIVEDAAKEESEEIKKIDVDSLGEDEDDSDDKEEKEDTTDEDLDNASGKEDDKKENVDDELDPKEEEKSEDDEESKEDEEDSDDDENDSDDDDEDEDEEKNEDLRTAGTTDEDMEDVEDSDDVDSKLDDSKDEAPAEEDGAEEKDVDKELDDGESNDSEDDEEEDVVIDNDEDNGSKDASINDTDEDGESKSTLYDELENEEDVQKAVELIKTRVADAEEAFIKRNAEDKEKMDDLLSKISDNVKTVEKIADNDSTKSKIAKENVQMGYREISKIHNKPQGIFEAMIRNLSSSIIKDNDVKQNYLNENGSINMSSIIETAKVMYGFLETLNTLQLEKVNGDYILKVLDQI